MERARRKETLAALNMNKEEIMKKPTHLECQLKHNFLPRNHKEMCLDIISPSGAAPLSGA